VCFLVLYTFGEAARAISGRDKLLAQACLSQTHAQSMTSEGNEATSSRGL
jgi:hypothetical protein